MKKLLLISLLLTSTSYGATIWKPAGFWYKEVTAQGSVRFSKMTDGQTKALCTVTPPTTVIGAINAPLPYMVGTRETTNPFGGFEVVPKIANGNCYAVQNSQVYDASQAGKDIAEILCPAWK